MNVMMYIKNPLKIFARLMLLRKDKMTDEFFIKCSYFWHFGFFPNLNKPRRYTEKSQWFKLNCRDKNLSNYVDKFAVREIVSKKIGEEYLVPLLGKWSSFDEIDFDQLPERFVLKCNHDSHSVVICKDKRLFNREKAKEKLEKALKTNFFTDSREWIYSCISPCIIAEKYLEDSNGELRDYKFWCFKGKVEFINVFCDRSNLLKMVNLSRDWKPMPFVNNDYPSAQNKVVKPQNFDKMLELAEKLSAEFSHVRMDFYNIDGVIYFGEYTFTPAAGFQKFIPDKYDYIVGDLWALNDK